MSANEVRGKLKLNSLKVLMELGISRLNQIMAAPFSVVGKALHMIASATL